MAELFVYGGYNEGTTKYPVPQFPLDFMSKEVIQNVIGLLSECFGEMDNESPTPVFYTQNKRFMCNIVYYRDGLFIIVVDDGEQRFKAMVSFQYAKTTQEIVDIFSVALKKAESDAEAFCAAQDKENGITEAEVIE
jgi:hypothetical protein